MRSWKTLGQRRRRARRGQVSAVATVLGLLLVVFFISNFVLLQLPNEEAQAEYQHLLQVEDQMAALQETILNEIDHASTITLTSPVTLGSSAVPPFAPGTTSTVSQLQESNVSTLLLTSAQVLPHTPNWGHGNLCVPVAGVCHNSVSNACGAGGHHLNYNMSGNNSVFTFALTGSSSCVWLNVTGSHDTVLLDVTGSNLGTFLLTLYGFFDTVELNNGFSGSRFHASFYLFGGNDSYVASGGPTGSNLVLNTYFVGESATPGACPSGNLSSSDTWSITGSSSSNSLQNFTWVNSVGYSTPYTLTSGWPGAGNSGHGNQIGWQNVTAYTSCAFTKAFTSYHTSDFVSGFDVRLNNRYIPSADVALDQGAVVLEEDGGTPLMIEPPQMTFTSSLQGASAAITLINLVGTPKTESGRTTAAVQTIIESISRATFTVGINGTILNNFPTVNITTLYPLAWENFFGQAPAHYFPYGAVTCIEPHRFAGSCWTPPTGVSVIVSAEPRVAVFTVTSVTIGISLL